MVNGDVVGVVLAGGGSRRFGGEDEVKALADWDDQTLIEHVVNTLREVVARTVVVVREPRQETSLADALHNGTEFAYDEPEYRGPLAGLYGALETVKEPWVFLTGCDMPLLDASAVEWLCSQRDGFDAVVPRDKQRHPLHAVYDTGSVLDADPLNQDTMMGLVEELDVNYLDVQDSPETVPLDESLVNVNTRDELSMVRELEL